MKYKEVIEAIIQSNKELIEQIKKRNNESGITMANKAYNLGAIRATENQIKKLELIKDLKVE